MRPPAAPDMEKDGGLRLLLTASKLDGTGGVSPAELKATCSIVRRRLEIMEMPYASVELSGANGLRVEVPGAADAEEVKSVLTMPGHIEFFGAGDSPPAIGDMVATGGSYPSILANADIAPEGVSVRVEYGTMLNMRIVLTGEGKQKLADFTAANVGRGMGISLDRQVLSIVMIVDPIMGGKAELAAVPNDIVKKVVASAGSGVLPLCLTITTEESIPPK